MVVNVTTSNHGRLPPWRTPALERDRLVLLTRKSSSVGALKVGIYFASISLLTWSYFGFNSPLVNCFVVIAMGAVFAHGLELQHEALHQNLFPNPVLNRAAGILLGIPMLVSYTHYKSYHFHHHVAVGRDDDEEIVEYSVKSLCHPVSLVLRAWNVRRVPQFLFVFAGMLVGEYPRRVKSQYRSHLFYEYVFLLLILAAIIGIVAIFGSSAPLILWFAPWLLVAEPVHFLIEIPEHIGCDRKTISILHNTRSYRTNAIWGYFANHNNYHIEHHLWPGIPAHRLRHLHREVMGANGHCNADFWQALGEVSRAARCDRSG